ncbi:Rha family transcriptional regulator [Burkholderia vietnamiensis]|uniref:Rha family transcriptional regulator n=1 Tax=Burkholderia vietnamiensis TaxID=60552 RepID=UPI0015947219|nr:Rha family transcriptional regulator [Burkholderia vietnamiensis]
MSNRQATAVPRVGGALVRLRGGATVTDSLTIAREFGRHHKHVLRTLDSLIADGTVDRPNFEPVTYTDEMNRAQRMIELDERGALIAMPFIGGRNSRAGQVRLVDAFLSMRARTHGVRGEARVRHRTGGIRARLRGELIALRLTGNGGPQGARHVDTDVRTIARLLRGNHRAAVANAATRDEAAIVFALGMRDMLLVSMGATRERRTAALIAYSTELRAAASARLLEASR